MHYFIAVISMNLYSPVQKNNMSGRKHAVSVWKIQWGNKHYIISILFLSLFVSHLVDEKLSLFNNYTYINRCQHYTYLQIMKLNVDSFYKRPVCHTN